MKTADLSDKAVAVFAFAAYHQPKSGQRVTRVVQRDGAGHRADEQSLSELRERQFIHADGEEITFTACGETVLQRMVEALRRTLAE
jgi:chromosome segregation and condensation protein ScpB